MISNSSRAIGDPAETGEEDDRETARAKGRVNLARAANGQSSRDGMREVGNMSVLGNCGAIRKMKICQTRGASTKVGDKKMFEIQNGMGIRGRKWKHSNPRV